MNIDPLKSGELVEAMQLEISQHLTCARDAGNSWIPTREQMEANLNNYVAILKARGLPVADWKISVQEATSYTISRSGKICLRDQDGNVIATKVKSKMTSRRQLHKRARSKMGHQFAFLSVQPVRPIDHIMLTFQVGPTPRTE